MLRRSTSSLVPASAVAHIVSASSSSSSSSLLCSTSQPGRDALLLVRHATNASRAARRRRSRRTKSAPRDAPAPSPGTLPPQGQLASMAADASTASTKPRPERVLQLLERGTSTRKAAAATSSSASPESSSSSPPSASQPNASRSSSRPKRGAFDQAFQQAFAEKPPTRAAPRGLNNIVMASSPSQGIIYRSKPFEEPQHRIVKRREEQQRLARKQAKQSRTVQDNMDAMDMEFPTHEIIPSPTDIPVPLLAGSLRHAVTNPGLHYVQDPRTGEFYFDPFLAHIHDPAEIDFDAIPPFVTTSTDKNLHNLAVQHNCRYKASTSSMTSVLSQLYFLFSNFKPVNVSTLSPQFQLARDSFTRGAMKPVSVYLRPKDSVYSIDSDPGSEAPNNQILLDLGKILERMLTLDAEEYLTSMLKIHNPPPNNDEEAYHFMKIDRFMMRSQLDCWDPEIPRENKSFDLKTRATHAIRIDCANYRKHVGYKLTRVTGERNSYEREYYDMIRAAFLKYSLQVRIGNMDGVMVAYHNTAQIFGMEYVPLSEMDLCVFHTRALADLSFDVTVNLFQHILDEITYRLPDQTLKVTFWANKSSGDMDIYVEPVENDQGWKDLSRPGEYDHLEDKPGKGGKRRKLNFNAAVQKLARSDDVYKYKLTLATFVNGVRVHGPLDVYDGDDVQVFHKLKAVASPQVKTEYVRALQEEYQVPDD